jgi:hypothetical protein
LFIWLSCYPNIENLLLSYRTARFSELWEGLLSNRQAAVTIDQISDSIRPVKRGDYRFGIDAYRNNMKPRVIDALKKFLHRYQEGALVMLALLDCARRGGWKATLPGIEGKDPVEIWCLVERLRGMLRETLNERPFPRPFSKYLEKAGYESFAEDCFWERLYERGFPNSIHKYPLYHVIKERKAVQELETLLSERWVWFVRQHPNAAEWWRRLSADLPIRYYLLCCAADWISFGEMYATLRPSTFTPYQEIVDALISLSQDTAALREAAEEREAAAQEMQRIEAECAERVAKISYSPPAALSPRVLSWSEIQQVKNACVEQLQQDEMARSAAATIEDFVHFCEVLGHPDNHIRIYTGQYVERQVNTRTYADMSNEMSQVLVGLERYSAYAKVLQEDKGEQKVLTQKIKTPPMPPVRGGEAAARYLQRVRRDVSEETLRAGWVKEREKIEEEMRHRQRDWPSIALEEPPRQSTGELEFAFPSEALLFDPDEPPPPSSSTQTPEALPNNATHEKADKGQLVYRSDFMSFSKDWDEGSIENVQCFRQDGYFHMAASNSQAASNTAWRPMADFMAFVDAQFMRYEVNSASYGLVFRADMAANNIYSRYVFLVSRSGYYSLWAMGKDVEPSTMVDWCVSEWLQHDSHATNSLMVQKVGQRITLGVNDHILTSVTDAKLATGKVGVFISPGSGTFVEARFRDFRLYAL